MFPQNTMAWGKARNSIRELAEYSAQRKREIGIENVYDFSIGNPNIPSPPEVNEAIVSLINEMDPTEIHSYTTAAGLYRVRRKIAKDLNERFGLNLTPEMIYITCGAAASLAITLRGILMPGEEVIAPAPCFPEYRVFTEVSGGVLVTVPPGPEMMVDLELFEGAITEKTKAVIINSPNNPSGTVFDEENLKGIADILRKAELRYGHPIFLISDEPYREIIYDDVVYHSPLEYYDDAVMCYSFSKSLSIPGERIGYAAVSNRMELREEVYYAIMGAGRALGYVNPPSLFQLVIDRSLGHYSDAGEYKKNRDILCEALAEYGYEFDVPKGAFYLFVKSPIADANEFSNMAKKYELMLVPSDEFGVKGYLRLSYCVSREMIIKALPAFKALMDEVKTNK